MYKKLTIGSAVLLTLGITVGFIGFPMLLNKMIRGQVNLKPGSETRKNWEKFPIAPDFKLYVFNVTNAEEVQNGGKPKLQEVGPFVFEEWKDKYNVEDIEEEDAVTFNMRNTFIFRPDLGLTGEEVVTIPHPLIQVMALAIKRDKEALLNMIAQGLEAIFAPTTPFITAPFMDIFYRGFIVDCSSKHFAALGICLNFHTGGVKGAVKLNDTHFSFSLMGGANHSDAGFYKVARGVKNPPDIAKVLQFENEDELSNWDGDECNRFIGTDSTIFPPLLKPEQGIWTFSAMLCRSMTPKFQKKKTYAGMPVYRYTMEFGDAKNEPEHHCFCKEYPDDCPPQGTIDMGPCNEAPMLASLPHFYKADPALLEGVEGLNPSWEKHGIFIDFERISGTPVSVRNRLQFSLMVQPIEQLAVMKDMRQLIMPYFWVEESIDLDKTFTDMLKKKVFLGININNAFKWMATILGATGCLFGFFMMRTKSNDLKRIFAWEANGNSTQQISEKY